MKINTILGISVIAGIVILVVISSMGNPIGAFPLTGAEKNGSDHLELQNITNGDLGSLSHSLILDDTLPGAPEKILIYKTVSPQYTRQDIISLGEKFGLNGTDRIKEVKEGSSIASEDGTIYAILHDSGFVEYHNTNRAHTVNSLDIPENLPSDDEAVQIATSFLKERNLLPEGAEFRKTEHGRIYQLVRNGEDIVTWEDINVWFGRTLNDYPVEGSQLMIAVGGNGDIIEYFTNWRTYEPYQELAVKTPEQAFGELKTRGIAVGMNSPDTVSVRETYLAYRTKAGAETEYYLEPVWVFKGEVISDGKSVQSFIEFIPALTDESVKSLKS